MAGALAASAPAASASTARAVLAGCSWQPLSLVNGWRSEQSVYDSGNPSYCVTSNGMVYLSGSLAQPGGGSDEVAVLPAAARPTHTLYLTMNEGPADPASLEIDPNGNMTVFASGAASGVNSLTGLSYQVSS